MDDLQEAPYVIIAAMRRYACFAMLLLCLLALSAQAADVSGQWIAQIPGRDGGAIETTFTFKVSGEQLTGSMENQYGEREISDGKVSGDDISFRVHIDMGGNDITFLFNGKISWPNESRQAPYTTLHSQCKIVSWPSGKTTLLKHLFGATHGYVSLEPPDVRAAASADPRGFLALNPPPANTF